MYKSIKALMVADVGKPIVAFARKNYLYVCLVFALFYGVVFYTLADMNTKPAFPGSVSYGYVIINTTSTSPVELLTGGSNGVVVEGISAVTTGTTDYDYDLLFTVGGTTVNRGRFTVVDGAGDNGTDQAAKVNTAANFPWLPSTENILLPPGVGLSIQPRVAISGTTYFWATGGSY